MSVLWKYLKPQRGLIVVALILAGISELLNLVDPLIFGKIIDDYALNPSNSPEEALVKGVLFWLSVAVSVAVLSQVTKAFQDYFTRLAVKKFGMQIFNDGLQQTLRLSYDEFEEQRSGATLSVLQKVKEDTQIFINSFINVVFSSVVGIAFLIGYSITKNWLLIPVFIVGIVVLGSLTGLLSRQIKVTQRSINRETYKIAGVITESLRNIELVKSLGLTFPEIRRLRDQNLKIFNLEMTKVKKDPSADLPAGNHAQHPQAVDIVHPPLADFPKGPYYRRVDLDAVYLHHYFRTVAGPWQHHYQLPRGGGFGQ